MKGLTTEGTESTEEEGWGGRDGGERVTDVSGFGGKDNEDTKMELEPQTKEHDPLTYQVIGCAMEVHRVLGPGLLESAYEHCLAHELAQTGVPFERQRELPVEYKDAVLDCGFRLDLLVAGELIVELKSVDTLLPIHEAQLLTYLRLARLRKGLLINFNVSLLKQGIKRRVL